jgi:hypothetical protein
MQPSSSHPDPPLEVSRDEERLGFAVHEVWHVEPVDFEGEWIPMVCKVLSSSDIVVKTCSVDGVGVYVHRRFGRRSFCPTLPAIWHPLGECPRIDPAQAVFEASIADEGEPEMRVIPEPAKIRKL